MKRLLPLLFILAFISVSAQVGIGTTSPESSLDVVSSNSGILIPRISLTMTTVMAPVLVATESELIYNTATTGDVIPGFYYWDSVKWVSIVGPSKSNEVFWNKEHNYRSVTLPASVGIWPGSDNTNINLSLTVNPGDKFVFGGTITITQEPTGPDNNGMLDFKMKLMTTGNGASGIPAKSVWGPGGGSNPLRMVKNIATNGILSTEIITISGFYEVPMTATPGTTILFRVEFGSSSAWEYEPALMNSYIWAMKM